MRVSKRFGVVESVACYGAAHYLVQAGIDYLCLDLFADLFGCVNPTLRQRQWSRCQDSRRQPAQILLGSRGLAEPEWHLGCLARDWW
jgi:hypothetical protein